MSLPYPFDFRVPNGAPLSNSQMDANFRLLEWIYTAVADAYGQIINITSIYADTIAGLDATQDGQFFYTPSPDNNQFLILWQNDAGTAQRIADYPSAQALVDAVAALTDIFSTDGTTAPVGTDWDSITTAGLYRQIIAGTNANGPGDGNDYYVLVLKHDDDALTQFACPYSGGTTNTNIAFRTLYAGAWSGWTSLSDSLYRVTTTAISKALTVGEYCHVTAAGLTLTLPSAAKIGESCMVAVGNFKTTVINPNGKTINGQAAGETLVLDAMNFAIEFVLLNTTTWGVK